MDETLWQKIREMFFIEKLSKSEIARRLKICRDTVKKACDSETCPVKKKHESRKSKLEIFKPKINELLRMYPELSAVRILEEINKLGYKGGMTILKDYLSNIRPGRKEAFVRIETEPADQSQVDWGDFGIIKCGECERKLSCFVMVLSYSRMMYIEWSLSSKLEDFIRCHINAFNYFKGVPMKILYDNLKSVVLYRYGKYIHLNPKFMRFAGIFPFSVSLCAKGKGNEKGKVESGIKYVRYNFFAGRSFVNFEDLVKQSWQWLETTANVRIHGTTHERPVDRYLREKDILKALPEVKYDCDIVEVVISSKDCRIRFDNNFYSIPHYHTQKTLVVKASLSEIKIYNRDKLIAVHKRCYEKYKVIEDASHIRGLLEIKKAAREAKQKDEFINLGDLAIVYFSGLVHTVSNVSVHIDKILKLRHKYGKTEVNGAIEKALKYQAYGANYIENIIITRRRRDKEPIENTPLLFPEKPELEEINISEVDLSKYDELP
jgi:transposase